LGQPEAREAANHGVRAAGYTAEPNAAQLAQIGSLVDSGKVRPFVSKTFGLDAAAAALSGNGTRSRQDRSRYLGAVTVA